MIKSWCQYGHTVLLGKNEKHNITHAPSTCAPINLKETEPMCAIEIWNTLLLFFVVVCCHFFQMLTVMNHILYSVICNISIMSIRLALCLSEPNCGQKKANIRVALKFQNHNHHGPTHDTERKDTNT